MFAKTLPNHLLNALYSLSYIYEVLVEFWKLSDYLPVVRKRRSVTRSECSESSKFPDDMRIEMDCLGTNALNFSNAGDLFGFF